jgi:hypothetical protein
MNKKRNQVTSGGPVGRGLIMLHHLGPPNGHAPRSIIGRYVKQ